MTFQINKSSLRTINKGDPKFILRDGLIVAPRAGIEISNECPREYRLIIATCMEKGWLKSFATVKDNELFWEEFSK
jgi:hypothetical protein